MNATDKNSVSDNLGRPGDGARLIYHVNASCIINATDKNLTKGWIGETAATCP